MKITCISASNVEWSGEKSASLHTCRLLGRMTRAALGENSDVEVVSLVNYQMNPCRMCGGCMRTERCIHDEDFNRLLKNLMESDGIYLVCPHYAPFPSKVMMLLEKMQEITYLHSCQDETYRFPLTGKPMGIVVHGGQTNEALPYYRKVLAFPLANAFAGVQMKIVPAGEGDERFGAAFGIQDLKIIPGETFVQIEHDWDEIEARLEPLVKNMAEQLKTNK